jgi:hypothetical protein
VRFAAVRECLQKQGITLPKPEPGQRGGFRKGLKLPAGESRTKLREALNKCGGIPGGAFLGRGGGHFFNSPAVKQAYTKFAACMKEHGVTLPTPNTSGSGPIFNTKGINTTSATFKAAEASCRKDLLGAFHFHTRVPGAGAPGAPGTSPGGAPGATPGTTG